MSGGQAALAAQRSSRQAVAMDDVWPYGVGVLVLVCVVVAFRRPKKRKPPQER